MRVQNRSGKRSSWFGSDQQGLPRKKRQFTLTIKIMDPNEQGKRCLRIRASRDRDSSIVKQLAVTINLSLRMASSAGSRDETVVQAGLQYWETQPASLDGVLGASLSLPNAQAHIHKACAGGFGTGVRTSIPTAYIL